MSELGEMRLLGQGAGTPNAGTGGDLDVENRIAELKANRIREQLKRNN